MVVGVFGKGLVKGMWTTLKHLFGKDLTIQYPEEMPYLQPRYRGHLIYEMGACNVCSLCIRTCPNDVLSLESVRDEETKKRKVLSFTIDHQYCMFCNLCVEACPTNCLYFNHDFELSQYERDEIKVVYERPAELDIKVTSDVDEKTEAEDKKAKQIRNMTNAVKKNPTQVLKRFVADEASAEILAGILMSDEAKLERFVPIMIDDREKASKVAQAFVAKELKQGQKAEGGSTE